MNRKRRVLLGAAGAALLAGIGPASGQGTGRGMKIGVIGSGRVGGTIGELWVKAGHEVLFSARSIDEVNSLLAKLKRELRAELGIRN